jgi:hypothetical protein
VPDPVASERLERLIETVRDNARRKNAARGRGCTRPWWSVPPGAGRSCSAAPAATISCWWTAARLHRRVSHRAAHRHHRLHVHRTVVTPAWRSCDPNLMEDHVVHAYDAMRPHFPTSAPARSAGTMCWCSPSTGSPPGTSRVAPVRWLLRSIWRRSRAALPSRWR